MHDIFSNKIKGVFGVCFSRSKHLASANFPLGRLFKTFKLPLVDNVYVIGGCALEAFIDMKIIENIFANSVFAKSVEVRHE